ncbi:hypothetical protein TBK1r_60800 [Stieleria magnilauensis]|uniref:Uncharacterized protein n=1 Tax=Stieleria magnilauensis TaxID=2527963 RepID=A0ABX5XYE8_9BACT|nr:hypothetical protein TBK1r_60020 [Planctomycetes bacterium TBK1r]QDV87053.1 hypothetical protein TBK1r_60800 [Planctomycetes bacterium TBK1r]
MSKRRSCADAARMCELLSLRIARDTCLSKENQGRKRRALFEMPRVDRTQFEGGWTSYGDVWLDDGTHFSTSTRWVRYPDTIEDELCREVYSYLSKKLRNPQ